MLVLAEGIQKLGKWAAAVGKEGKPAIRHTTPTTSGDRRWSSLWLLACSALANTGGKRGGGGRGVGRRKCTRGGIGQGAGRDGWAMGKAMGGAYLTGLVGCWP